jgi:uncharacterized protein involved in type VI secretion and phage assembly
MTDPAETIQSRARSGQYPMIGKYRGMVTNNRDPQSRGRVQVTVPSVIPAASPQWAEACVPYAGNLTGMLFLPMIGDNVWVEFEGGDISKPVWAGCFWNSGMAPGNDALKKTLKTLTATLTLSESPGDPEVTIETVIGAKITIQGPKITIDSGSGGSVVVEGPRVTVNNGALEVI